MNYEKERHESSNGFSTETQIFNSFIQIVRDTTDAFRSLSESSSLAANRVDEVQKLATKNESNIEKIMDKIDRLITFHDGHRAEMFDVPKDALERLKRIEKLLEDLTDSNWKSHDSLKSVITSNSEIKNNLGVASSWIKTKLPVFTTIMLCFASALGYFTTIRELKQKYEPIFEQMIKTDNLLTKQVERNSKILEKFLIEEKDGRIILNKKPTNK